MSLDQIIELVVPLFTEEELIRKLGAVCRGWRKAVRKELLLRADEWGGRALDLARTEVEDELLRLMRSELSLLHCLSVDLAARGCDRVSRLLRAADASVAASVQALTLRNVKQSMSSLLEDLTEHTRLRVLKFCDVETGTPFPRLHHPLRSLSITFWQLTKEDLDAIAMSSSSLVSLELFYTSICLDEEKFRHVAGLKLPALRKLRFVESSSHLDTRFQLLSILTAATYYPRLTRLHLHNIRVSSRDQFPPLVEDLWYRMFDAAEELQELPRLKRLVVFGRWTAAPMPYPQLELLRLRSGAWSIRSITSSSKEVLTSLRALDLNHCTLSQANIRALAELPALEALSLQLCVRSLADLEPIFEARFAKSLKSLSVEGIPIAGRGLRLLAESFTELESLDVSRCSLDGFALSKVVKLGRLRTLTMHSNTAPIMSASEEREQDMYAQIVENLVDGSGAGASIRSLPSLRCLDISRSNVSVHSLHLIAVTFPSLVELDISGSEISSLEALRPLADSLEKLCLASVDSLPESLKFFNRLRRVETECDAQYEGLIDHPSLETIYIRRVSTQEEARAHLKDMSRFANRGKHIHWQVHPVRSLRRNPF